LVPNRDPRIAGAFDLDKPLYTISVASEILETHPRTLMMYEDLGLIEPYRTATNRRRYSQLLESLKRGGVKPPDDLKQVYDLYEEII